MLLSAVSRRAGIALALIVSCAPLAVPFAKAGQDGLVEPRLHLRMAEASKDAPRVALTFDACMGKTDARILATLIDNRIPATIFVTARWLRNNAPTAALFAAHPDLFEVEDHGAEHVPAVDRPLKVYGIAAAGSAVAVESEVTGGASAIAASGLAAPRWFRGATAKYSPSAIADIRRLGLTVAGFSINGDGGAMLGAVAAERAFSKAKDGDVIIAHLNQPGREAGAGVVRGILDLKARGYRFVRLQDAGARGTDGTTD
ncbi:Peptidoglycan/xylan/chitin deacetylase, PgdA/CDA1 family [Rhizobium sp. RU20A]|uniref:polysaccharide deacetylase family protein n=1 Tax=Rhizobium sp. RU20A TaxID=1907412 RepID=UPI00095715D2|nr:polysaccharide deacetylase family protein [Rhizobium sp. RU20A]SIQ14101.1 Peptidoglycan/xylan/chitin deacetylase, PgdA/CDA1 family [Rhizobium sp. RU20A]